MLPSPQQMNIFCLPFSGGTVYSYQKFKPYFPKSAAMIPLELPGHGRRLREPLLTDVQAMSADIFQQIRHKSFDSAQDTPYALYGHSLGALLAYLVTLRIVQEDLPRPVHLFVSGHQGPAIPEKNRDLHLLPRKEFLRYLQQYGGIPDEVAAHAELMDLFIPLLKADFQAISTYHYLSADPLDLPVTVMFGSEENISKKKALAWQEVTTGEVQVREFPGQHFFIFEHAEAIVHLMLRTLFRNFA